MKPMYFTGHTLLNLHYPPTVDVERCGNQRDEEAIGRKGKMACMGQGLGSEDETSN
jgi:hypothetical protein